MRVLLLICLAGLSLTGCKKKYCYNCVQGVKTVTIGVRYPTGHNVNYSFCDMTQKDMDEYIQEHSSYSAPDGWHGQMYCYKQ
jgi:hypothetical protein